MLYAVYKIALDAAIRVAILNSMLGRAARHYANERLTLMNP